MIEHVHIPTEHIFRYIGGPILKPIETFIGCIGVDTKTTTASVCNVCDETKPFFPIHHHGLRGEDREEFAGFVLRDRGTAGMKSIMVSVLRMSGMCMRIRT